jgi:hypothetical protein
MTESTSITRRQLRLWGLQTGGALIVLGSIVFLWRGHGWGRVPLALGALFLVFGVTTIPPARYLFRGWHAFVGAVLWLWTRLALLLTYVVAVTPLALVGRLIGRDRMRLRFPGRKESYWQDHTADERPDRYYRQF